MTTAPTSTITPPRFRLGIFSCLSLYRKPRPQDFGWTLLVAAMIGALYGVFVAPVASNALAYAQAWAGLVDYSKSPWALAVFAAPSLQTTLPALALHAGADPWTLALASSALFSACACMAMAAVSYILTRHMVLSLVIPVALLGYHFTNNHAYPVVYPLGYFQLGQTAQYVALLAFALAAGGRARAAGITGGILIAIDPVWSLCVFAGIFPVIGWLQPKLAERWFFGFVLAAAAALLLQHMALGALPAPQTYTPAIPAIAAPVPAQQPLATPVAPAPVIRALDEAPRPRLQDAASPLRAAYRFFLPAAACLFLSACLIFTQRRFPLCLNGSQARQLLLMAAIPVTLALLLKLMEELDPALGLLTHIDYRLPALYTHAIPLRWLNLATLLVPMLGIGILVTLARDAKSWLATLAFIAVLALATRHWSLLPPVNAPATLTPAAALLLLAMGGYLVSLCPIMPRPRVRAANLRAACLMVAVLGFAGFMSMQLLLEAHHEQRFTGIDATSPLLRVVAADKGQLLLAPDIDGAQNRFNPQLGSGRAIVPPAIVEITDTQNKAPVRVFCHGGTILPRAATTEAIRTCFEKRSLHEWRSVARALPASGLLVPKHWKLKLPATATGGGLRYYRLPR